MRRCRRLNLTPLCYLWQRNQQELLSEMIDAGMDAILIKVAGIGLTTAHLGKNLVQMEPTLLKLVSISLYSTRNEQLMQTVSAYIVWITYLRRRWRVRELDFRLPPFQTSYSAVSFQIGASLVSLTITIIVEKK